MERKQFYTNGVTHDIPAEPPKTHTPLSAAMRKDFQKLIDRRQQTILKSLDTELEGGEDVIASRIRQEKGLEFSSQQLETLINDLDEQITRLVARHLPEQKRTIQLAIAEVDDKIDAQIAELKREIREKVLMLEESRKKDKAALKDELKKAEKKIASEFAIELVKKSDEYRKQLTSTRVFELELKTEVTNRLAVIRQSKGRLKNLIVDAAGRSLEDILYVNSVEAAKELVERIPTVSQAIQLTKTKEGMNQLFRMLDPNTPQLPPPVQQAKAEVLEATVIEEERISPDERRRQERRLERELYDATREVFDVPYENEEDEDLV